MSANGKRRGPIRSDRLREFVTASVSRADCHVCSWQHEGRAPREAAKAHHTESGHPTSYETAHAANYWRPNG